jgi:hypothetical protein
MSSSLAAAILLFLAGERNTHQTCACASEAAKNTDFKHKVLILIANNALRKSFTC